MGLFLNCIGQPANLFQQRNTAKPRVPQTKRWTSLPQIEASTRHPKALPRTDALPDRSGQHRLMRCQCGSSRRSGHHSHTRRAGCRWAFLVPFDPLKTESSDLPGHGGGGGDGLAAVTEEENSTPTRSDGPEPFTPRPPMPPAPPPPPPAWVSGTMRPAEPAQPLRPQGPPALKAGSAIIRHN